MSGNLRAFTLPLTEPLGTAAGRIAEREGFVVPVEDDGAAGVGEATPLPGWTEPLGTCQEALEAALERLHAGDPDGALADVDAPAARHGLALALADARASAAGEPLYGYLGGEPTESVPVNATVGDAPRAGTVAAARGAVEEGYDCLKLKVGARPVGADAGRLRAVREAVGPGIELRADANGAWTEREARAALDAFADAGVAYVEQPLPAGNLEGHASLRGGPVGIALDETLAKAAVGEVLAAGAADVLVLKPMVLGGPDRARAAARRAAAEGVSAVVTTTIDGVIGRTGALHVAASLPGVPACGLATGGRLARDLAPDPATVADGRMTVPQGNGLGVDARTVGR